MRKPDLLLLLLAFTTLAGCSRPFVPFTVRHMEMLDGQSQEELRKIQFYISEEIRLRRDIEGREESVEDATHTIRVENRRKIVEIKIPRHTPGVLNRMEGDTLYVQFEGAAEDADKTIPFTRRPENLYFTEKPEHYVYQFRPEPDSLPFPHSDHGNEAGERSPYHLRYDGKIFEVLFSTKKTKVDEANVDMFVGSGDRVKRHYYMKTLYPVLVIEPVHRTYILKKSQKTVPGKTFGTGKGAEEAPPLPGDSGLWPLRF